MVEQASGGSVMLSTEPSTSSFKRKPDTIITKLYTKDLTLMFKFI